MITLRLPLSGLASAALLLLASCAQPLPDVADIDRYYQRAEQQAQAELKDLEQRRAAGQIDDYTYQQKKASIQNGISQQAIDMAWTSHSLATTQRASRGLPTPNSPQEIAVPQAGTLATGGDYRRFNDQNSAAAGTTTETVSGMSRMMTNSGFTPGAGQHGKSRSGGL